MEFPLSGQCTVSPSGIIHTPAGSLLCQATGIGFSVSTYLTQALKQSCTTVESLVWLM